MVKAKAVAPVLKQFFSGGGGSSAEDGAARATADTR
jgi:hypothetical protein